MQAAHVETVALHAVIPAVREADRVAAMLAASAVVMLAAIVVAAAMLVALAAEAAMLAALAAAAAMLVVAAAMAAAGIGKLLRFHQKSSPASAGELFCGSKTQTKRMTAGAKNYCGRTSMPVTVA
jgi:hypothetical protein